MGTEKKGIISKFQCQANCGIGYAYWILFDYKNIKDVESDNKVIYDEEWTRSEKGPSVSLGLVRTMDIGDTANIKNGALIRLNIQIKAGKNSVVGNEIFTYSSESSNIVRYNAKGSLFNPKVVYLGSSGIYGKLEGYKIQMSFPKTFDHTFVHTVNESTGEIQKFACNGRSDGGNLICSAYGDVGLSEIIAAGEVVDNVNQGTAGIVYLLTGVCHQIANRILAPSKMLVQDVGGYSISQALYGDYGHYYSPIKNYLLDETDYYGKQHNLAFKLIETKITESDYNLKSISYMIGYKLGYDFSEISTLVKIFLKARNNIKKNSESIQYKNMSDTEILQFVQRINTIAIELQNNCANILSDDNYLKLFDLPKNNVIEIETEETALSNWNIYNR